MKVSSTVRPGRAFLALAILSLTPSAFATGFHGIPQAGPPGKVRPQVEADMPPPPPPVAATPVQVTVTRFSQPVAGISVTFKTSAHSVDATTNQAGVAKIHLLPGYYAVSASSGGKSATTKIHVTAGHTVGVNLVIPGD